MCGASEEFSMWNGIPDVPCLAGITSLAVESVNHLIKHQANCLWTRHSHCSKGSSRAAVFGDAVSPPVLGL